MIKVMSVGVWWSYFWLGSILRRSYTRLAVYLIKKWLATCPNDQRTKDEVVVCGLSLLFGRLMTTPDTLCRTKTICENGCK